VKIAEALDIIRRVGAVESSEGKLKLKFPESERAALQPAIDALRSGKKEALALLAEPLKGHNLGHEERQSLEDVLNGLAVELWSNAAGRLFIVADEDDARRLGEPRGIVYTASEVRREAQIADPAIVREIHRWKREFNGRIREVTKHKPATGEGGRSHGHGSMNTYMPPSAGEA
jgi:hypothetical protein